MELNPELISQLNPTTVIGLGGVFVFILMASIWELVWKGIALWKAGNRKQATWFIFLFIFNTAGILPIIYLIINRKKNK